MANWEETTTKGRWDCSDRARLRLKDIFLKNLCWGVIMEGMELGFMFLWLLLLGACIVIGNKYGGSSKEVKPYVIGFILTSILGMVVS